MLKIWPFHRDTRKPRIIHIDPQNLVPQTRSPEQRAVIDNTDYHDNFHETEDLIIEFAPREKSADPQFRKDFSTLAADLKTLDHPGLLQMYSFGEEDGRLYRTWAKRRMSMARASTETCNENCRQLAQAVEGFQALQKVGVAVERYSPQFISRDPHQGLFIARFPFTREGRPARSEFYPHFLEYAIPPKPESMPAETRFLIRLGVFIGVYLMNEVPFSEPPLLSEHKGTPIIRKELALPDPLKRLTQLDPNKNYPDLATGLAETREALQCAPSS